MLERTGHCVLSANDGVASDQAGGRRRRPRPHEEGPGGRRKQRHQGPRTPHWVYTRNTPRRAEELLQGGSLYWVVRGVIRCRQELVGFEEDFDKDRRQEILPHQGQAPPHPDRAARPARPSRAGATSTPNAPRPTCRRATPADMPAEMAAELKRLGLL